MLIQISAISLVNDDVCYDDEGYGEVYGVEENDGVRLVDDEMGNDWAMENDVLVEEEHSDDYLN